MAETGMGAVQIAQYAVLATAVFVALGGIMGFVKAKSKASLIAGVISGIVLGVCYFIGTSDPKIGLAASCVVLTLLDGMFAVRLKKTKKFMPSGMMLIICSIAEVLAVFGALEAFGMM